MSEHVECKVCGVRFDEPKPLGYCEECWGERRKHKYVIEIGPPTWGDEYFCSFHLSKQYGNCRGRAANARSKEELMDEIKRMIRSWEGFDPILEREGDPVNEKTLWFWSFTDEVTKGEALGNERLENFL